MKPVALILVLLLTSTTYLFSQHTVKGRIVDHNNSGITYANVLLLSPIDSSLVKGAVTDGKGYYSLSGIKKGQYMIQSYMIGYGKSFSKVFNLSSDAQLSMQDIILAEDAAQLDEVVVQADKPLYEMEMGKMVINVTSSITSTGQSAIDVLEKSPGVNVNRQNNTFALGGKNGVIVLMNGKRSRMPIEAVYQLLSSLNAGDIEKIEIMTVPPAKYDADGDAGFINIVMKKGSAVGTNGTAMVNAGYGSGPRGGTSLNLSHQQKKFGIYGNYSFNYNERQILWNNYRENSTETESSISSTEADRYAIRPSHNYSLGFDYYLGKKTVISALMSGYNNGLDRDTFTNSNFNYSISPDTLIQLHIVEEDTWKHLMGNINIQHTFDNGQVINANLDYLTYQNFNLQTYENDYYDDQGNIIDSEENRLTKKTPIDIWVAKLDHSININDNIQVETGIKGTFSKLVNDVLFETNENDIWLPGDAFTSYADLTEDVLAAYTSLNAKFSDKTSMKAGLRVEQTKTYLSTVDEAGVVDRNYVDFFPSVFVSHKINKDNLIQLSYGRRITRPSFNEMAPWIIFLDPYTYFSGNANILPTYTNSFKTEYSYKSVLLSLQYSHDQDVILRFQPTLDPETNVMVFAADNIDRRETISTNFSFPIHVNDWWEMQNNFSGNWQLIATDNEGTPYERSQFGFQVNSTQTFKLPHSFVMELSGFYVSPSINGYFNWLSRGFVNLGVQKSFDKAGTLRLACNDIFETAQYRWQTTDDAEFDFKGNYKYDKRVYTVTYTYKFGNSKAKKRKRSVGSAEEMRRVNN
ncbi:MAG: TonB-dependent receptor [Reichenbachiella sp.]